MSVELALKPVISLEERALVLNRKSRSGNWSESFEQKVRGGRVTAAVDGDLGREKRAAMHVGGSELMFYYRHIKH